MIQKPSKKNIEKAVKALAVNKIVCLQTDTLYSLSCNACDDSAVQKVFNIKKRAYSKALPVFVANLDQAYQYGLFNYNAINIAKTCWPGPITLVVPLNKGSNISKFTLGNLQSVAIRIPNTKHVIAVIKELGCPIVGTSANISSEPNCNTAEDIIHVFKNDIEIIIADTNTPIKKVSSTILDCTTEKVKILRGGALSKEYIEKACNIKLYN